MRIAVISDIHGNYPALQAILSDIGGQIDLILCLGDIVGYFAEPEKCLRLLQQFSVEVNFIQGNHEALLRDECWKSDAQNEMALAGICHADSLLTDAQYNFLQLLPRSLVFESFGIAISHDTFSYPGNAKYVYFFGHADNEEICSKQIKALPEKINIGFLGHTHMPYVYEKVPGRILAHYEEDITDKPVELKPDYRYLINPGSVGQPRDGDRRASYGLLSWSDRQKTFCLKRISYDVEETIKAIDLMEVDDDVAKQLKNRLQYGW